LSPFLFSVYTNDLIKIADAIEILKYADDTLIVGRISADDCQDYFDSINHVVKWCEENGLFLNENKTKELCFDFRLTQSKFDAVMINSRPIEQTACMKYLGCNIDKSLQFKHQAQYVICKAKQRRHLVYLLYSFNVERKLIQLAYGAMVRSVLSYAAVCYYQFLSHKEKAKYNSLFSKIPASNTQSIDSHIRSAMEQFATKVRTDSTHPLHDQFILLPSARRLSVPFCRTARHQKNLVVQSILLSNSQSQSHV
jgi:hypothetical protein